MNLQTYYPQYPYATLLRTSSTQRGFKGLGAGANNNKYYCTSLPWAGRLYGLGDVGEVVPHILTDAGLGNELDKLIRGATVKAMKSGAMAGLGGINTQTLERVIMHETLKGLANGDIQPLSKAQYDREMMKLLSGAEMAGFFDKLVKPLKQVKKAVDKVTKPIRHKIEVAVKKVAPVVVAGAVTYFTGGTGVALLKKYSPTIGQYWKSWDKSVGKVLGQAPPAAPADEQVQYVTDPTITNAAVPMAQYQLSQQGIDMNSPEAQATLAAYIRGQQAELAQASGNPNLQNTTAQTVTAKPAITGPAQPVQPAGGDMAKLALPLAAAAALMFMMK
jgi:hypothetical protein